MNFSRFSTLAALFGAMSLVSLQAAVKDLPVKKVNGSLYHYYEVPSKETVYSLCYKLNISKDEIIKHNPSVADGLRAGMTLFFPVEDSAAEASESPAEASRVINHHVQKGETIFGIARKYGVTTDEVIAWNPILKDGLKAGQTISITLPAVPGEPLSADKTRSSVNAGAIVAETHAPKQEMRGYIVKKKETFYSIAVANGITVAALEAANPGVASLKEGQVLNIPVAVDEHEASKPVQGEVVSGQNEPIESESHSDSTSVHDAKNESVSVAVMLPFMLEEESPSKSALRYTEFYKGFLIAVDSLRNNGTPIHVTAYDTEGSVLNVREALTDTAFYRHDAIIAPDNVSQFAILAEYGRNNNVKVFNTFLVRDDSYLTNPAVMQCNLPSALMYRKAIDALMERLAYSTPVFVSIKGTAGDKEDFVSDLKEALAARGKTYMDIEADSRLGVDDLTPLPADGNYTFIPSSSRQADLNRLLPGIIEWRDRTVTPTVRLFGYPEWTTFRGETLENMHNINTTVYSRFYTDEESLRTRDIDAKFKQWYGNKMENAVPRQGLLGFDMGMFIVPYLLKGSGTYDGVQNGYFFSTPKDGAGVYNEVLYFVNFRPGNVIEKSRI